jgi:hypothetical protein
MSFCQEFFKNCNVSGSMLQSGTGVSVEAVDPVFQTKMLDMLKQTGRYGKAAIFFRKANNRKVLLHI